ncbi:MAG: DUF6152 family protein [Gammaproteobacteria bacterium]
MRLLLRLRSALVCLVLLSAVSTASAHHSPAMFDMSRRVLLKGNVREFQWTNPHSYIQLLVRDEAGNETEWNLEMAAPNYLYNNGWRPGTLKNGDNVVVTIAPLKSGADGGLVVEVTMADGRKLGNASK